MAGRHGWNSWDQYWAIHDNYIRGYLDHFILDDTLAPTITEQLVRWKGTLYCADGIEIAVQKVQDVRRLGGRAQVKTRLYSYQVQRRIAGRVIELFRYDNAPHFNTPEAHHVHRFDENGIEVDVRPLTGDWPTLGDMIAEAYEYWHTLRGREGR